MEKEECLKEHEALKLINIELASQLEAPELEKEQDWDQAATCSELLHQAL